MLYSFASPTSTIREVRVIGKKRCEELKRPWVDLSQPLDEWIAEWPGDTPFFYERTMTIANSGVANVGKLTMSTHIGTHVDAPYHYDETGLKIREVPLEVFIGKARVIDVSGFSEVGRQELERYDFDNVSRILLKTGSHVDVTEFPKRYTVLNPDVGILLKERGVRLLGVDTPSVDAVDSEQLPVHHTLYANEVFILENLVLRQLEPGDYELIALPLALSDADGSPVRAVARKWLNVRDSE